MQLGPRQREPQMPNVEVAFDDLGLGLVDHHLRVHVGAASVKVRVLGQALGEEPRGRRRSAHDSRPSLGHIPESSLSYTAAGYPLRSP